MARNQIIYWMLDCNIDEFQLEFTKVYQRFQPEKEDGALNKDSFGAWIRVFIKETNPFIVAKVFGLFGEKVEEDLYFELLELKNTKSEDKEIKFSDKLFELVSKTGIMVRFKTIIAHFLLFFLNRVLLKINRRLVLYESVANGEPEQH